MPSTSFSLAEDSLSQLAPPLSKSSQVQRSQSSSTSMFSSSDVESMMPMMQNPTPSSSSSSSAAFWGPKGPSARRRAQATNFMGMGSNGGAWYVPYDQDAWYGERPGVPSFQAIKERAELGNVKIRLKFQTPEVYSTDIASNKMGIFDYACKVPPKNAPFSNLGEPMTPRHPEISLRSKAKKVRVVMKDVKTGEVYWDADYKTSALLFGGGKRTIKSTAVPENKATGSFNTPCLPRDDPDEHEFDISIQGRDGYYDDNATPYGNAQGMDKPDGIKAHIGFTIKRMPRLMELTAIEPKLWEATPWQRKFVGHNSLPGSQVREFLGEPMPGMAYGGAVRPSPYERWLNGEQDLNMNSNLVDNRLYYDYTYKGKLKDYSYWTWLGPDNPINLPREVNFAPEEEGAATAA